MALLRSGAWKWIALIGFLFAPGTIVAYVLHSAVWIFVAPVIFVVLMAVFILLLSGETTSVKSGTQLNNGES
jgi:DMSO/TMAO reductase YedYZ heme-binding membrane subunit